MTVFGALAIALAAFVAQTVKGVTGFGSAMITLPVMMAFLSPAEAILLLISVDTVTSALLVLEAWSRVSRRLSGILLLTMSLGQMVGTSILFAIDERSIAHLLGVLVVLMGARLVVRPVIQGQGELHHLPRVHGGMYAQAVLAGSLAGLLRGTVGAGGPPLIVFLRHHFQDDFARAQLLVVMTSASLVMAVLLLAHGTTLDVLRWNPVVLVPGLLGSQLGAVLAKRASRHTFGRITGVILLCAGLALFTR